MNLCIFWIVIRLFSFVSDESSEELLFVGEELHGFNWRGLNYYSELYATRRIEAKKHGIFVYICNFKYVRTV